MRAFILSTGDELVRGRTQDTNTAEIARALAAEGIGVVGATLVGDDLDALVGAVRHAAAEADVVFMSGGLGPTEDDCTRRAAAAAGGVGLVRLDELVAALRERYAVRGRVLAESNLLQCDVPEGAEVLPNRAGTAPGFQMAVGEARLFALPGPPHELRIVLAEEALPRVRALLGGNRRVVRTRTLETFGWPEARVGEALGELMARDANPRMGTTARLGTIKIVLHAEGAPDEVERVLAQAESTVRGRLGDVVYGSDGVTLAAVVGGRLIESGTTVACAESCTGGLVSAALTDVPGISAVFPGSAVTYANEQKSRLLGVSAELLEREGAVSEEVARAMAIGVRRAFCVDRGVAVTGIAGPGGGSAEKPVGLVHLAVATPSEVRHRRIVLPGERHWIRAVTVKSALALLRSTL